MAINGEVHSPNAYRLGIAEESTFGTAIADAAAFKEFVEFDSISVDYGIVNEMPLRHRSRRLPDAGDTYTSQTGGIRTVTVSGLVVRQDDMADLLYGVTQSVSEDSETPYQKSFSASWTAQPDFSASAGIFFTVALRSQIDGYHEKYTSCIIKSLTLSYDGIGGDGRIKADVEFITGFAVATTSTYSGTWTVSTQTYFNGHAHTAKTIATNDIVLYGWDMTINNNAVRVGNNSSGNCETYAIGVGGNGMEITGSVKCKYDANTQGLKADYLAGTERGIVLSIGSTGVDGFLGLALGTTHFTGVTPEDAEQGQAINVAYTGLYASGGAITVSVADAVDRSW